LVFAPSSLILTNYYLPLSGALGLPQVWILSKTMVHKILLSLSLILLLSFSVFSLWFPQYSYEKSKFTIEQMTELQNQFITTLKDESIPINRVKLVSQIEMQHELNLSNEEYVKAKFDSSSSLAELLFSLLAVHLVILFWAVRFKSKPNKKINKDT
jgi:ABC-type transport system involved in cytochrome bd biosynthesis fused ATPase/permease subunit